MLVASYAVNYLVFRAFSSFAFMASDPAYLSAMDPHGLFNAWRSLVFQVTTSGAMFLALNFELWPLSRRPALVRRPMLGVIWTAFVLVAAAAALLVGVGALRMDPVIFMVRVPIPIVFGTIIVATMLQDSVFARFSQPLKGLLTSVVSAAVGVGLARLFGLLGPSISGPLPSGPPGYGFEIWLASALLAVTFPFLIIFADLFGFWPLRRDKPQKALRSGAA